MGNTTNSYFTENRLLHLGQAMFYNCSGMYEKLPVCIIRPFNVEKEDVIWFTIDALPVTDQAYNIFAAELFFYKKGEYYSAIAEGVAELLFVDSLCVKFTVTKITYTEYALPVKKKSLQEILPMLKAIPSFHADKSWLKLGMKM